jgi:hypothetical protein
MFKRFIALCLLLNVVVAQANVAGPNTLKTVFDELNYTLAVDWDQQDKKFYTTQMKKFQDQISNLQVQGLSNADLVKFAKSQIKDAKVATDLETAFTLIQINKLSNKDARKLVLDTVGKTYNQGASWSGDAGVVVAAAILLILVVAIAVSSPNSGGINNGGGAYCYDEQVCYDYYDAWGFYWYTDCYWETWCY